MLDVFTALPWQLQVLCFETILSGLLGLVLFTSGYQRSWKTIALFIPWNIVIIGLLVTGGNASWQHVLLASWYLLDTMFVIGAGLTRKKTEPQSPIYSAALMATIVTGAILLLIVTG